LFIIICRYEQPKTNPLGLSWTPHQLVEGPDFFIQLYDIDGDGNEELLSGEFFGEKIVIYYKPEGNKKNKAKRKKEKRK